MKKFIKSFLITLGVIVFVLAAGFGITYAVDKDFALDLLDKVGIHIEEPVEQPDDETPGGDIDVPGGDIEQPGEDTPGGDIEIPGEDTGETEEPENPDDSEEPDDTETYICNVSDYEFDGNTITAYNGDDKYIQIPSSYSISGTEMVKMTFDEMEFQEYLMMNFKDITYPITITDANSEQYTLNSEMDVFENQDIVYPVSLDVEKPIFVEGNDYQVSSVGGFAFSRNENIEGVIMPNTIKQILEEAFYGCSNLSIIEFSNKLEIIARSAFAFNSAIISINLPASLTKIEDTAFLNCNGLTSITIPEIVASIGERAFQECSSLESITINATTPPTLGRNVMPSNVKIIYVPAESVEAYKAAWSDYADKIYSIEELKIA